MRKMSPSPLSTPAIEAVWIQAAAAVGFRVERTCHAYASSDGQGTIFIGQTASLDVDDSVAQLIYHELCHALVEAPEGLAKADWGLDNTGRGDVRREHACLRLQAHLADPHGCRALMAPTTEYRAYHDALPADPLSASADPAADLAGRAATRAGASPWKEALEQAFAQTVALLPGHPLGFAMGPASETCGSCAWIYLGGHGRAVPRCRQAARRDGASNGGRTTPDQPACDLWELPVDCRSCGACCREAYHSVTVSVRDPVVWRHPSLITRHGHRFEILREGDRCAALEEHSEKPGETASGGAGRRFGCTIYQDRPRACRDFEAGGRHCLDARRRVGLSR
jgi:hypothetical protein